jgi:hypothetical protein
MALRAERPDLVLSEAELRAITGYVRPSDQVSELRRQGFYRARRARDGSVVLERVHYDAVCGRCVAANEPTLRP